MCKLKNTDEPPYCGHGSEGAIIILCTSTRIYSNTIILLSIVLFGRYSDNVYKGVLFYSFNRHIKHFLAGTQKNLLSSPAALIFC